MRGDLQEGNGCASRCQSPSSRAQNLSFCALLPSGTLVFGLFEHKIWVFVSEWVIFPGFWVVSSTKSGFLCAFCLRDPRFRAFQAQNRHFCVRMGDFSWILCRFEHKIWFFVRFWLPWPRVTNSEVYYFAADTSAPGKKKNR